MKKRRRFLFQFASTELDRRVGIYSFKQQKHVKTLIANVDSLNFILEDHTVEGES